MLARSRFIEPNTPGTTIIFVRLNSGRFCAMIKVVKQGVKGANDKSSSVCSTSFFVTRLNRDEISFNRKCSNEQERTNASE
jgi:hypothetical protein